MTDDDIYRLLHGIRSSVILLLPLSYPLSVLGHDISQRADRLKG
jgi:hypothetical protein